jgi:signal transduction histidine kinase
LKNLEQSLLSSKSNGAGLEKIQWLQSLAGTISRDIHQVASDLRPTAVDDVGLYEALSAFCSEWSRRFGIKVDVQVLGDLSNVPAEKEIAIYRIVQEALNNVVKHANASAVSVVIDRRPLELRVIVEDNGIGFDTKEARTNAETGRVKLGLSGIEERLTLIDGSLTIESERSVGTTLFIFVPLSAEKEVA